MKRSNLEVGLLLVLSVVVLVGAPSGVAAASPAPEAPTSYDFSRHFCEPLGWPLAGEFGPGKDGRKPAITVETDDVHTAPTAIRLDTAGCKQSVLVLNYVLPENLIEAFKGKPAVFSGYVKRVAGQSPLRIYQRNFSQTEFLLASRTASAGKELGKWERLELRFVIPPTKDVVRVDFHSSVEATSEPTVVLVDDCQVEIAPPAGAPGPNGVAGIEPAKEPLVLVQDGKPATTIVVAKNATSTVRFAASELNRHLKLCAGAELPVAQDGAAVAGATVQIGSTALTERFGLAPRFHVPDHWAVWRVGSALVLSGGDAALADADPAEGHLLPFGTLYATYEFLERVLGVRWYWPGDLGRVAPKHASVSLARAQWSGAPAYDTRSCFYEHHDDPAITRQESNLWWRRMRRGAPGGSPIANHSYNQWPARYGKTHPEYFALQRDGKRLTGGSYLNGAYMGGHVCHSNPDVLTGKPLSGARFVAMPFDLPASQTHGFWVDLYVPAGTKPGEYRGVYRVRSVEGQSAEVPVVLTVWGFDLPQTPTMKTEFGSPAHSLRGYYENRAAAGKGKKLADEDAAFRQVSQLLSEHRFNATPKVNLAPQAQPDGTFRIPSDQTQTLRDFVDRYHVNAVLTPHPNQAVKDPEAENKRLGAWLAAWDRAAAELDRPNVVLYTYLLDEPNDEKAYRYVQQWGRAIRRFKSALKVLVVEQTLTQDPKWGDLNGAIDIWCPLFCLHDEPTAAQRRALGESVWTYTALCQGDKMSPWWQTDFPLLHYRVPSWIAWRYRMTGLLYWGSMSVWSIVDDPWTQPGTYDLRKREKGPLYNGEGSLLYPGRDAGYEGVVASLRLKALRDSIEDYEYFAILERLGRTAEAEKIVLPQAGSFFQWNADPKAYDDARARLAALILAAKQVEPNKSK